MVLSAITCSTTATWSSLTPACGKPCKAEALAASGSLLLCTESRPARSTTALALRKFALGIEALHRFVEKEPLYRVHECVFGVLALESEPVNP